MKRKEFISSLSKYENWLVDRILYYAIREGYSDSTSTLMEPWRQSIAGLSNSIVIQYQLTGTKLEISSKSINIASSATEFGEKEAHLHRKRGVTLEMFLGLMKYYRQTYIDFINERSDFALHYKVELEQFINRHFDLIEIAFCKSWFSLGKNQEFIDLQRKNRELANEKNKYITIFESLPTPVFIIDDNGYIENMNFAASNIFFNLIVSGFGYYSKDSKQNLQFASKFPWLEESYNSFVESNHQEVTIEARDDERAKIFTVSFSRVQDISEKFIGVILTLSDITERKRLETELSLTAITDPLTGAKNRRFFLSILETEINRCKRQGNCFALIMIDLDNFKLVNDNYGHDAGDKVLIEFVKGSHRVFRNSDCFARWGGEEFIAILPATDEEGALRFSERYRESIASIKHDIDEERQIQVTISIGLTVTSSDENNTIEYFINKADQALYSAKNQGRNRVCIG